MRANARLGPVCALVVAAATGGLASCTEINAASDHVAALEFDTLPAAAVVTGDTLRDSLGRAAPLKAIVFNGAGNVIAAAAVQYVALDTGVSISATGYLTAQRRSGTVRVVANAGSLQSHAGTLIVARRPDSVFATGTLVDTLIYVVPDNVATNASPELAVKVITRDTSGGIATTQGWLVSFQAFHAGAAIAPGDTSVAYLLGTGTQRSRIDTTGTDGIASRRLRVRPIGITTVPDSVIVLATVRYRGANVRGSPVRFVILLRPK